MNDMEIVNRSFITIKPTQSFWNWANKFSEEMEFSANDSTEGTVYLVEEDFFDVEPILKKQYKKIFKNELSSIIEEEENWPEERTFELFLEWFHVDYGAIVVDLEKSDLQREKF